MSEVGKPRFFDIEIFCDAVEMLIMSDEVERALWMLDNGLPAYYREPRNYPPRAAEIRESLHRQLFTPAQYSSSDHEGSAVDVGALATIFPHRAQVVATLVYELNERGIKPNLLEIGPGTFWLPYALRARGLQFSYEYQSLNRVDLPFDKPKQGDNVNIFLALELIEHLSNEMEIYQAYLKFNKPAAYIYISTPLYTCGGVNSDWRNHALGHLRTYTPQELADFCNDTFKGYNWLAHLSDTITIEGTIK